MKKLFTSLLCTAAATAFAQWSPASLQGTVARKTEAKAYYKLNLAAMRAQLGAAQVTSRNARPVEISLPTMDGRVEKFSVYSFPVMSKATADRYQLGSYVGVGIDDPTKYVRFSVAPNDFQSMIIKDGKYEFIEAANTDKSVYSVHAKTHPTDSKYGFSCSTSETPVTKAELEDLEKYGGIFPYSQNAASKVSDRKYRTMRLAISTTGEYTQFFGGVPQALAQVNATMTRVNGVFEKEFALHLNVQDFPELIFPDPTTDPYSTVTNAQSPPDEWNDELTETLHTKIGDDKFDIGHLFGASGGGGNAGCIGCVCSNTLTNYKGSGITSPATGSVSPTAANPPAGDNYDIDYVAHEMGHQLGANHTFSHRVTETSYGMLVEPGSGSTIMGYAGITGANTDIQKHSDPWFHTVSIGQVQGVLNKATCAVETPLDDAIPVIEPMADVTIPKSTAFVLTAKASDPDNDPLLYSWEEVDNATVVVNKNNLGNTSSGASFRVLNPTASPTRYFPQLSSVLKGVLNNANSTWEAVSTVARTTNFRVLVRENNASRPIQQTQNALQKVVVGADGPFRLTSKRIYVDVATSELTWDVAKTNAAPYNSPNVKIDYTVDDGANWTVLADSTPNDGAQAFSFSGVAKGASLKVRVSSIGNVFYAIGSVEAAKSPAAAPNPVVLTTPQNNATNVDYRTVALKWTAATGGEVVDSYDVYLDTNADPTTLVGNTVDLTFTVTNLAPSTKYYWKVVPKNTFGSTQNVAPFAFTTMELLYCDAGATATSLEKIQTVTFADINNTSASNAGYEDFTSIVGNVEAGKTYDFSLTAKPTYATDQIFVWIDYNRDKVFSDNELVYKSTISRGDYSGQIKIPENQVPVNTRMRIRLVDTNGNPTNFTPCGNSRYGQVEDYTLNITNAALSTHESAIKNGITIYPNPATDVLNVAKASANAKYTIYSIGGSVAASGAIVAGKINVSSLTKGVYLITIQDGDARSTLKFIKN